ncbi:DNA-processing protein DprA [Jiangella muralis]|uniref:DNA-processing protein DprA n=1 Tax=Jiangella muralis TaxID=702383 RepID=UPI00069FA84D|nr:DNA-processing protein DprA [Jiangella muralis]
MITPTTTDTGRILDIITAGDAERLARVALALSTEPGEVDTRRLDADSATTVVHSTLGQGRSTLTADRLNEALAATKRLGFHVLIPGDEHWPVCLADLGPAQPLALWAHGRTALLAESLTDRVAVTGSRAASHYGQHTAHDISYELAQHGHALVTGGSYGVDAAAHRAALLASAATVAVLPTGLDRPYPQGNADLLADIAATGVLLSESPPGTPPSRTRFVQRCRIIAALAGTTVIIEAAERSGALVTAHRAIGLFRVVAAVPGPVTSATSVGCHRLIQDGETHLVTGADDVVALISGCG